MTFAEELKHRIKFHGVMKNYLCEKGNISYGKLTKWMNGGKPKEWERVGFLAYLDSIGITGKQ